MKTFLLDGDILVYTVAFACAEETQEYLVMKTADSYLREILSRSRCDNYIGFLTDSETNFRNQRATTWVYKGQREQKEPPKWKAKVKEHYLKNHGWQLMRGIEADDALTIAAEHLGNSNVVCGTVDKDLLQYPWTGFMNLRKGPVYSISETEAHENLWRQVLVGDKQTDSIPGLSHAATYLNVKKKFLGAREELWGPARADKFLLIVDPEMYAQEILNEYVWAYDGFDFPRGLQDKRGALCFGEYRFHETFDLIRMLLEVPEGVSISFETSPTNTEPANEFL